ncbi:hypothetical protein D9M71_750540 [compost metagenome]
MAIASVVHEHVDRAQRRFDLSNDFFDTFNIGDIKEASVGPAGRQRLKCLDIFSAAQRPHYTMSCGQRLARQCSAKAATDTRDQD